MITSTGKLKNSCSVILKYVRSGRKNVRLEKLNVYFNEIKLRWAEEYAACNKNTNPINRRNLLKAFTAILFNLFNNFYYKN